MHLVVSLSRLLSMSVIFSLLYFRHQSTETGHWTKTIVIIRLTRLNRETQQVLTDQRVASTIHVRHFFLVVLPTSVYSDWTLDNPVVNHFLY